jgi:hypothetical protein
MQPMASGNERRNRIAIFNGLWSWQAVLASTTVTQLACAVLATFIWLLFYPGILDGDGIGQYRQAFLGSFNDWSPPIMAAALRTSLKIGTGLSVLSLLQALAGCFGIYHLALACFRFVWKDGLSPATLQYLALAVLVVLLVPLSPLMYYLVHFSKDSWAAICLAWIAACGLTLYDSSRLSRWQCAGQAALLLAAATVLPMVRYNAVLMLPVLGYWVWLVLGRAGWKWALVGVVGLVVLRPAVNYELYSRYHVSRVHPEDQIMGAELVGLCVLDENRRSQLPFTNSHLIEDKYRQGYIWGTVDPLFLWFPGMIVKPEYAWGHHDELSREYWHAVRQYPLAIAKVKWLMFTASLTDAFPYWHHSAIDDNDFGLTQASKFPAMRGQLERLDKYLWSHDTYRWISGRHGPWILANGLMVALALAAYGRRRQKGQLVQAMLLVLPFCYVLCYVPATASHNYRYMFPSSLVVQIITLTGIMGGLATAMANTVRRLGAVLMPLRLEHEATAA